jgi:hypothetical protein
MPQDYSAQLDRLNPDLTLDLERTLHFLDSPGSDLREKIARLRAVLMRQYRYGKSHGFEGAMDAIRKGRP